MFSHKSSSIHLWKFHIKFCQILKRFQEKKQLVFGPDFEQISVQSLSIYMLCIFYILHKTLNYFDLTRMCSFFYTQNNQRIIYCTSLGCQSTVIVKSITYAQHAMLFVGFTSGTL